MLQVFNFPVQRYTGNAILFHWLMALMLLFMAISGLLFDDIPKDIKPTIINLHAITGTAFLVLLVARIWWRINHRPPPSPPGTSELNRRLSHIGHLALYALMVIVPLAGLVYLYSRGRGLDFGFFQLASPFGEMPAIRRPARVVHSWSADILMVAALGHIAFALWHQFVMKDNILLRMMPKGKMLP